MLSDLEKYLADVEQGRVTDDMEPLARSNLTERGCQEDRVSKKIEEVTCIDQMGSRKSLKKI